MYLVCTRERECSCRCFGRPCAGTRRKDGSWVEEPCRWSGGEQVNCPLQPHFGNGIRKQDVVGRWEKAGRGELPSTRTRQATCGSMYVPTGRLPSMHTTPVGKIHHPSMDGRGPDGNGRERGRELREKHPPSWTAWIHWHASFQRAEPSTPKTMDSLKALSQPSWPRNCPQS